MKSRHECLLDESKNLHAHRNEIVARYLLLDAGLALTLCATAKRSTREVRKRTIAKAKRAYYRAVDTRRRAVLTPEQLRQFDDAVALLRAALIDLNALP